MKKRRGGKTKRWNWTMRRSAWLIPAAGAAVWLLAVALPAVFGAAALLHGPEHPVEVRPLGSLVATSAVWAAGIALASMIIGWWPGRAVGALQSRRAFAPAMAMLLAPVCVPAYVVFWCWWQFWPPESAIFNFAVEHDLVRLVRSGTLALGLVCWSWPIVAWCVASSADAFSPRHEELLALDGATLRERLAERWRRDRRGLIIGGIVVALATVMNTTCFDLAEVYTFSNELRAIQASGAEPAQVMAVALPTVVPAIFAAMLVWFWFRPRGSSHRSADHAPSRVSVPGIAVTIVLWCAALLAPMGFFISAIDWPGEPRDFLMFYDRTVAHTVTIGVLVGAGAALIAAGFVLLALARSRVAGAVAAVLAMGWIIAAAMPAIAVASAFTAAYNQPAVLFGEQTVADVMYATPAALVLAQLARFAFVAALIGRAAAMTEPGALADLRKLDDAVSLRDLVRTARPRFVAAIIASFLLVAALSMSEIAVTAHLYPPGFDPLAPVILNAMHYQQPETVMVAAIGIVTVALVATLAVGLLWLKFAPRAVSASVRLALPLALLAAVLAGCEHDPARLGQVVDAERIFGSPGTSLGQFTYPRAIASDCDHGWIYVIDKTARVQRFGLDGEPQLFWRMPRYENGKPTGVSVAPDGRVFVADTHEFRVMIFDSEGHELGHFGGYGTELGKFIYTTDIAFAPNGRMYVSEYGGNDRIQVFDAEFNVLFQIGGPGDEPGRFSRPQSMCFSADGSELFVADSCNHRIQVFTPNGELKRILGRPGREAGELAYPYGIVMLDDGSLLVTEFGNNRVQRLSAVDGSSLGVWGTIGRKPGQLQYPWATTLCDGELFILDSGNNRVQVMTIDSL